MIRISRQKCLIEIVSAETSHLIEKILVEKIYELIQIQVLRELLLTPKIKVIRKQVFEVQK